MTSDLILALISFAFVTSATPGPNNLMLMASGANFGIRRTLPHWLGVSLGFVFLAVCLGIGLSQLIESFPIIKQILTGICTLFLLYLAWKIATAAGLGSGKEGGEPLSFLQAAAFQWVNPKAIAMALSAISLYTGSGTLVEVLSAAIIFGLVNFPTVGMWVLVGTKLRHLLQNPRALRIFNVTMALLLVATLYPIYVG